MAWINVKPLKEDIFIHNMKYMYIFNYMFTSVESSGDRGALNGVHGVSVSQI